MKIYKEIYEEVEVDVNLEDFDFEDICDFIVETSKHASDYENICIDQMRKSLFQEDKSLEDFVHAMERDYFDELFETMKNSWQALV
jgi:uncharacterized protein YpuA (DUF1002 family)